MASPAILEGKLVVTFSRKQLILHLGTIDIPDKTNDTVYNISMGNLLHKHSRMTFGVANKSAIKFLTDGNMDLKLTNNRITAGFYEGRFGLVFRNVFDALQATTKLRDRMVLICYIFLHFLTKSPYDFLLISFLLIVIR
jgi:hypothetical protein